MIILIYRSPLKIIFNDFYHLFQYNFITILYIRGSKRLSYLIQNFHSSSITIKLLVRFSNFSYFEKKIVTQKMIKKYLILNNTIFMNKNIHVYT